MPSAWGEALMALGRGLPGIGQSIDTYNQNKWIKEQEERERERAARESELRMNAQRMQNSLLGEKLSEIGYQKTEREKAEKNFFDYLQDARDAKNIPQLAEAGPSQQHDRLVKLEEMQGMAPVEKLNEYDLIGGSQYSPKVESYVSNVLAGESAKQKASSQLALNNLGYEQDAALKRLESQLRSDEERKKEAAKLNLEKVKISGKKDASSGKPVSQNVALNLSSTEQGINMLDNLVEKSKGFSLTNTPLDKLRSLNPWDKDVQAFNQLLASTKQVIGKGLEGGVLRKEDEFKYDKILPKLGDTEGVRLKKADQLREMLVSKHNTDLNALGKTGADISNFSPAENRSYSQPKNSSSVQSIGTPTPQTQDEYNALPSGTIYIDPEDGRRYRKP